MKLGVFGINAGRTIGPGPTARLAGRCEELGYDSWWAGEHVVLPSPRVAPAPMRPTDPILDPLVHLAYVAGATDRMLLGTGIIILPQRNPLVLAKQIATLDLLSGGRFVFGVGVGYLEPELTAFGVPMSRARQPHRRSPRRHARHLVRRGAGLVRWSAHLVRRPRRASRGRRAPSPSSSAVERVVRTAGRSNRDTGGTASSCRRKSRPSRCQQLGEAAARFDRPAELGELEISITPAVPLTADLLKAYADAGVHRLIVYPVTARDEAEAERFLEEHAALVLA